MADPRVINLPDNPAGPDSSGVGKMLFDRMQGQFKDSETAKQLDITEGIKAKYKAQADEKANQYNQGMEVLRSTLTQGNTDRMWAEQQRLLQQEAIGLEQMVGQATGAGVDLPGMTQPPGETMGSATIPGEVNKINPNAVVSARAQLAGGFKAHFDKLEQKQKLSYEAEKNQMAQMLDITTEADARQAQNLAGQLELNGDSKSAGLVRGLYGTAGLASKTAWQNFQKAGLEKLVTAQQNNETKLQVTKETNMRHMELRKLIEKGKAQAATTKLDNTAFKNMKTTHDAMNAGVSRLEGLQQIMSTQILSEMPGSPEARKLQSDMLTNKMAIDAALQAMQGMQASMIDYQNRTVTGERPPVGGLPPKAAGNDPMGIRPVK